MRSINSTRSCVRRCRAALDARTAFSIFSTACWAWNPMISSGESGSGMSFSIVNSSCFALRERSWANSRDRMKYASFPCGFKKQGSGSVRPLIEVLAAGDKDIHRSLEGTQSIAQSNHLFMPRLDFRLDHRKVEIATLAGVAPRIGAKQDNRRSGSDPLD